MQMFAYVLYGITTVEINYLVCGITFNQKSNSTEATYTSCSQQKIRKLPITTESHKSAVPQLSCVTIFYKKVRF